MQGADAGCEFWPYTFADQYTSRYTTSNDHQTRAWRYIYANAQIPKYRIVNPFDETITVLTLDGDTYATHSVFGRGETATSPLLNGFAVSVDAALDAR